MDWPEMGVRFRRVGQLMSMKNREGLRAETEESEEKKKVVMVRNEGGHEEG